MTARQLHPKNLFKEISGACGDLGLFLSISLALHVVCGLSFVGSLAFVGVANIITGFVFRIPLPVQPMKAIAAIAIAGSLSAAEVAAAGLLTGLMVLSLTLIGGFDWLYRVVPMLVIRALQLGLALKLGWTAVEWLLPAADSGFSLMMAALALTLALLGRWLPAGLLIFLLGLALAARATSEPLAQPGLFASPFSMDLAGWWQALQMGLAQLPLTTLNSVLAVVLLSRDLFPAAVARVTPSRMGGSVGVLNIIGGCLGLMPVCHGSGGLAAQYHFGARSHWSVVGLGVAKLLIALLAGTAMLPLFQSYPQYLLGVLILFSAWELARHGLRVAAVEQPWLWCIAVMIASLGSLPGVACAWLLILLARRRGWLPSSKNTI